MLILFINNKSINSHIDFIHSLFIEYKLKIIFIENIKQIIEQIKIYYDNDFLFIDYFNDELFKILKFIYNISIYYYTNSYSTELLNKMNIFSKEITFNLFTHNEKYKYVKYNFINYINKKNIKIFIDDLFFKNKKIKNKGFIVLTYVENEKTNKLWNHCIYQIRKYNNNKIVIINDNSCNDYFKLNNDLIDKYEIQINKDDLKDIEWINSEYPQRGEILPYYYLYSKNLFEKAMIIHDSTFIQKKINIDTYNIDYLWHFNHHANDYENETNMIKFLQNENLIKSYDAKKWYGCFGCQTIISYDFIKEIHEKYNIFELLKYIDNRPKRMNFERIFSLLCTEINKEIYNKKSIYGDILEYQDWGLNFNDYKNYSSVYKDYDLIKTWCGR